MSEVSYLSFRTLLRPCPLTPMTFALQAYRMQNCGVMKVSLRFQKKTWEVKRCINKSQSPKAAPERTVCVAVKVKPKLQWRPRKLEMPRMWSTCLEMLQAISRASPGERPYGLQPARPEKQAAQALGKTASCTMCPVCGHGAIGYNVHFNEFQSCLSAIYSCYFPIPPFWHGNVYSVPLYLGSI